MRYISHMGQTFFEYYRLVIKKTPQFQSESTVSLYVMYL